MLSGDETPLTVRREYRTASPIINSRSPTRVTINAFFAAEAAFGLKNQNPTRRDEHSPTSSQNRKNSRRLDASIRPSIPPVKRAVSPKYVFFLGSSFI